MLYRFSCLLIFCFFKLFCNIKIEGRDSFPKTGPFILASNHISNLDPPVLAIACPRKISFLAKEELFKNKLVKLYLLSVGAFPLRRGKTDIKAIRLCLKILKKSPLLVFPQGRRGADLDKVNAGVGFLHKKTGAPIIAARIYGTDKVLPKGAKLPRRSTVKVVFSQIPDAENSDNHEHITGQVVNKIKDL